MVARPKNPGARETSDERFWRSGPGQSAVRESTGSWSEVPLPRAPGTLPQGPAAGICRFQSIRRNSQHNTGGDSQSYAGFQCCADAARFLSLAGLQSPVRWHQPGHPINMADQSCDHTASSCRTGCRRNVTVVGRRVDAAAISSQDVAEVAGRTSCVLEASTAISSMPAP